MDFLEIKFPDNIAYGSTGGPEFCTAVSTSKGKRETRNSHWMEARRRYKVTYDHCNSSQIEDILSFFSICKGMARGFRYCDWTDYIAREQYLGTGDGTICSFQLTKKYTFGSYSIIRTITKPVRDTVLIKCNNQVLSSNISIDYTNGVVEFTTPPERGALLSASFLFDVPVRFDTDFLPIVVNGRERYAVSEITLIEIKVNNFESYLVYK